MKINGAQAIIMAAEMAASADHSWTTGVAARNRFGRHVELFGPDARKFCQGGARVLFGYDATDQERRRAGDAVQAAASELYGRLPTGVNDYVGREATLKMLARAFELAAT